MTVYQGKGVLPGIAFGTVHLWQKDRSAADSAPTGNPHQEWERFQAAKAETALQLDTLVETMTRELGEEKAMIIDVQRMMLDDGDFNDTIESMIKTEGLSAPQAALRAGQKFYAFFDSLDDPYMKSRAIDVTDMSDRLVDVLLGHRQNFQFSHPVIVVADDLTPSETLQMDKSQLRAFVVRNGSANSHTAILARTMNIPCVVQADIPLDPSIDGKEMIVNGKLGLCYLEPDDPTRLAMLEKQAAALTRQTLLGGMRGLPTVTKSGKAVHLFANIGSDKDLESVREHDAEGIGLFRSEFLYLGRGDYPTEDELFEAYYRVIKGMEGKKVIIRTLDIGADKKADYFQLDEEANPALGLRGVRLCLDRPELFRTQLRAIYRASAVGHVAIMFPMITSLWEIHHCKEMAAQVRAQLAEAKIPMGEVEIGVMIETPAAVMVADSLAKEVDFFSVGTNDLTQYTLAADRQNDKLEPFYDPYHPAVFTMLRMVAQSAKENGIWAGICGELASIPALTRELIEMGFEELSVTPACILDMRKRIRDMD